jgi:hypothetical protein
MTATRTLIVGLIVGLGLNPGAGGATAPDEPLPPSAEEVRPVLVGTKAPDGPLRDSEGRATTLAELRGGDPTVLVFYRGHW